ncbi:MAG: hypothetical protein ACRYGI_13705 [Janthinobacterium lividum]
MRLKLRSISRAASRTGILSVNNLEFAVIGGVAWSTRPAARDQPGSCFIQATVRIPACLTVGALETGNGTVRLSLSDGRFVEGYELVRSGELKQVDGGVDVVYVGSYVEAG